MPYNKKMHTMCLLVMEIAQLQLLATLDSTANSEGITGLQHLDIHTCPFCMLDNLIVFRICLKSGCNQLFFTMHLHKIAQM